jgi:hypothetical protein
MSPAEWPLLAQVINFIRKLFRRDSPSNESQSQGGNSNAQQASHRGKGDIYQVINQAQGPPQFKIPWPNRPGAPQFRLDPGIEAGRLLCEFRISGASPVPGGVEARWVGAGTNMNWTRPMPQNVPVGANYQSYQLKAVEMKPTPPDDKVVFEVRFNLDDGQHGGRWVWPMHQDASKGHWILDADKGSYIHQPRLEDAW